MPKTTKKDFKKSKERKEFIPKGEKFTSCNDVKWYTQNPQVAADAAKLNFATVLGQPSTITVERCSSQGAVSTENKTFTVPGIMVLNYLPTIGKVSKESDNVNVAARLVYTFIRHVNSGSRNYEAPDYMTYLLGVANAHAYYAYMTRIYGLLNVSSVMNRYINKTLIQVLGGDYDNLVANMASFRYYINQFAVKLNSLAVPKDMYYFDRLAFLPLHVFKDGEGAKAQMYVFKPAGFYTWSGTKYETGSALVLEHFQGAEMQLTDYIAYGNKMIDALLSNEDIGIMSGDTLKAFGDSGIRQLGLINPEYSTLPIKDDGVLSQIHNASSMFIKTEAIETLNDNGLLDITQKDGVLVSNPKFSYNAIDFNGVDYPKSLIIDSWMVDPTMEYVLEATRFMCIPRWNNSSSGAFREIETCGTEILLSIQTITKNPANTNGILLQDIVDSDDIADGGFAQFDWAPIVGIYNRPSVIHSLTDLQNYTIVDVNTLDKVHNAALQSLFNVYHLYVKQV